MSKISGAIASLESQKQQLLSDTLDFEKLEFELHKQILRKELRENAIFFRADMQKVTDSMQQEIEKLRNTAGRLALRRWEYLLGIGVFLFLSLSTLLWFTGQQVTDNLRQMEAQRVEMRKIAAWGVETSHTSDGEFLILPKGVTATTGWKVEGGREAVRLNR